MKKLLTGMLVLCMVLGFGSLALAQTGEVSVDQWFTNHVWEVKSEESSDKIEATARLTGLKGEISITDKIGVAGSFVFGKSEDFKEVAPKAHAELSSVNVAAQYQIVPMIKARGGFFSGKYTHSADINLSGITLGAAVDAEVSDGIGVFGEVTYAPKVTAKRESKELKDVSMVAFEAGGKYDFGQFGVKAGYRNQGFDFKDDEVSATFSGFFVGVSMNF
ncbi:MAG: hypothetical protein GX998_01415 [Firmicutes bacterium]|mgnify:CR=1 FL=1|nr:hypothetical protein [Bacillota bacterium]